MGWTFLTKISFNLSWDYPFKTVDVPPSPGHIGHARRLQGRSLATIFPHASSRRRSRSLTSNEDLSQRTLLSVTRKSARKGPERRWAIWGCYSKVIISLASIIIYNYYALRTTNPLHPKKCIVLYSKVWWLMEWIYKLVFLENMVVISVVYSVLDVFGWI